MRSLIFSCVTGLAASALIGCGGGDAPLDGTGGQGSNGTGGAGGITVTTGRYDPLVVNSSWKYHVNDKGIPFDKTSVVEAIEEVGGVKAGITGVRVRDTFPTEVQLTWYEVNGDVVVRHREMALDSTGATKSEDFYEPYRLRVDETAEHMTAGATWTQTFSDAHTSRTKPASSTSKTDSWKVDAVDQSVTVPAGTFAALRVTRTDTSDGSTKTYWFVRGVGKVKEATSGGHIEELTEYTIP